ncbi:TPA: hypothetical protein N0F65_008880 [Lagenidium giganteum]|uniref:Uncharacterized protein n=1 Tax=Lagenidium giganteum TaxID=4803 RepID=A0AAV2Z0N1_9STRA|nr:TPA: hypothetical protein N0F65_008880 [Lagenidium giganteum]
MREVVLQVACGMLLLAVVVLVLVWVYRYIQYKQAVKLSQERWLQYETATRLYATEEGGADREDLDWPSTKPLMLSPIPEEHWEHGRESMDSSKATSDRRKSALFLSYGSFERQASA